MANSLPRILWLLGAIILLAAPQSARAEEKTGDEDSVAIENVSLDELLNTSYFDLTLDQLLGIDQSKLKPGDAVLYGFIRGNVERVFHIPSVAMDGSTEFSNDPLEYADPNLHIFGVIRPVKFIDILFNIGAEGANVDIRSAYGNIEIDPLFQIRVGRMYRRFGNYNEKLDQFPTFLGIEPPELFDKDHLFLPRRSILAIHGRKEFGDYGFFYYLDSANGEGGAQRDVYPLGWDFRVKSKSFVVGTSGFLSSIANEGNTSTVGLGEGSPRGGVLPWMSEDRYVVFGAFGEYQQGPLLVQAAYWRAEHNATRDPASVLTLVTDAGINPDQRSRFLGANAGTPDMNLTPGDVVTDGDYSVQTFYIRAGYNITTPFGVLTPYAFIDWMEHEEAIQNKDFGGDNEAGFADDGMFWKPSIGVMYKPWRQLAVKVDGSAHIQEFNGSTEIYPEIRFDASFAFTIFD